MRLVVENLACRRGVRLLFAGLGFTLEAGRALIVTGPNGTGKSSMLRLIAGLARPEAGRMRLEGAPEPEDFAEEVHYLGHLDAHKGALSAQENLAFWRDMLGRPALTVAQAMEAVGLGGLERLPVAVLSAGQKRRLALARLLVAERPLWLLDEPTTALDVTAQARFAELARAHVEAGGLIVAATHAPLDFGPSDALDISAWRPARAAPEPAVSA
ncbi:heme ABC exporter ATP-binding protein CcmA [Ancylobacter dichloromethanicus]|uniref:Cytochrome c biogenesis ATP-binding export protein CcmA n=1 Tax=Ancylobacter dichloromethanicus TaxID=518825 RepID=A0A9W6J9R0_9HYPH|nr:heme ABC exporter ATP-binding protein CcmA [Ancylobacter dichloromethanicus]MBS7553217.1 heme ABC exporter ATP-binding protein CcmA [Ancylobacter dichloromethanicus]GLK72997.1 cytochrome c biogenesis ATP-binding export protein CcmA [Ancylobacter dichloromethanicus]